MRPCIRSATLDGFAELAHSLGLDPAHQIAAAGLDVADLAVPDRWVPAAAAAWLLEMSAAESGVEDFGLRMSERRRLATLGPLSVVLREEPDLRSALQLLIRYEYSYNEAVDLQLAEANGLATIRVRLGFGEPAPTRQALELAVASLLAVIRRLVRTDWQAQAVCFSHPAPERLTTHRRLLGPAPAVRPRVHADWCSAPANWPTRTCWRTRCCGRTARTCCRRCHRLVPAPLVDQVRELVETLLPVGRHSMRQVAHGLGLTPRTLRRRLEQEDETFSSIVDDARTALAERYLANDRLSLTEVSYQLGFDAPSAFSRWFRHRFGISPTRWRQLARGPARR